MRLTTDLWESSCTAVVFCGGRATRLQPILRGRPKALVTLSNRPYLTGLLKAIATAGITEVILCISTQTELIASEIGTGAAYGLRVRYTIDSGDIENAGALWNSIGSITTPLILCINGDTIVDIDYELLIRAHIWNGGLGTLVGSTRDDQPHPGAVEVGIDGWVREIYEQNQDEGKLILPSPMSRKFSNSGVYVFTRETLLSHWPSEVQIGKLEQGLLRQLAKDRLLWAYDNQDRFLLDLGEPDRLAHARASLQIIAPFFPLDE